MQKCTSDYRVHRSICFEYFFSEFMCPQEMCHLLFKLFSGHYDLCKHKVSYTEYTGKISSFVTNIDTCFWDILGVSKLLTPGVRALYHCVPPVETWPGLGDDHLLTHHVTGSSDLPSASARIRRQLLRSADSMKVGTSRSAEVTSVCATP